MIEQPLHRRSDVELVAALRSIAAEIAWPAATAVQGGPDLAQAVRARIEASPRVERTTSAGPVAWRWPWIRPWRPARRALLIAIVVLIALAALAGAAGLGLPGLRILFGSGPVSPPPSLIPSLEPSRSGPPGEPGDSMGLGDLMSSSDLAALNARAGFEIRLPADPLVGPPDAAYIDETTGGQVSLVWASRANLPATLQPGVGLVLTEFRGAVAQGFFDKVLGSDTTVEPAMVNGEPGYWLSGAPHFFFYEAPGGIVHDDRRWVGDALLWSEGPITYRIESAFGRDTTIRIAESLH